MEQNTDSLVKELSGLQKKVRGIKDFGPAFYEACDSIKNGRYWLCAFNDSYHDRDSAVLIAKAIIEADNAMNEKETAQERIAEIKCVLDIE